MPEFPAPPDVMLRLKSVTALPTTMRSMPPPKDAVPFMPSSIDQSMPSLCVAEFWSSTNRASMYTWGTSTSMSCTTRSQASRIAPGAVTITVFASGNACAIFAILNAMPKSPLHVLLNFSATSSAFAWWSWNVRVEMRRFSSNSPHHTVLVTTICTTFVRVADWSAIALVCGGARSGAAFVTPPASSVSSNANTPSGDCDPATVQSVPSAHTRKLGDFMSTLYHLPPRGATGPRMRSRTRWKAE